jgi:NAD(P)-dependent dehydrogenase (short-subunit alcohol dehydrogenase family)
MLISFSSRSDLWFITGASRGFGSLVAERALTKGDNVVATARNPRAISERLGASSESARRRSRCDE